MLAKDGATEGGPDIAVEIVSRDSRGLDYGEKRQLYEQAVVEEYWIVDPIQRRAEFLRIVEGSYSLVLLTDNRIFESSVVPGFWLDVDWLLADDLPDEYGCLDEILKA